MAERWVAPRFGDIEVLELVEFTPREPGPAEVTIEVRAVGVNPWDFKSIAPAAWQDPSRLPVTPGSEVAGIVTAAGSDAVLGSGEPAAVGMAVLAFPVPAGYATAVTVPASAVFAKPERLDFAQAANLLLVGTTARELLHAARVERGDTVLVHGASGAVGVSVLQQARLRGATVIGTAGERNHDLVRGFGATAVSYGPGLEQRVRELAPQGIDAALDTVGTDEAVDASLALVADRSRVVTIASPRADEVGILYIGGGRAESTRYRNTVRAELVGLAAAGELTVPLAKSFRFEEAKDALGLLRQGHPGGKLALIP